MKKTMKRFAVVLLTLCITFANLIPAAAETATVNSQVPTVCEVMTEAQKTAAYLMDASLTNKVYSSMNDTSSFYNASRNLLLALRSGYDCSKNLAAYTENLDKLLDTDGYLTIKTADYGYPSDIIACQAYAINVLTAADLKPKDFNDKNLLSGLSKNLQTATADTFTYGCNYETYENSGLNPYYLGVVYTTVKNFSSDINNSTAILENIRTALNNISDTNGVNYYGYSADNNAWVLPGFNSLYETDSNYKTLVTNAISYTKKNFYDSNTGAALAPPDYSTGLQTVSSDSTALALTLYCSFDYIKEAATSYNALLKFASTATSGMYTYDNDDSVYSTQDALVGLVSYQYALCGVKNVFDISKKVDFNKYQTPSAPEALSIKGQSLTPYVENSFISTDAALIDEAGNKIDLCNVSFKTAPASEESISNLKTSFNNNNISINESDYIDFYDFSLESLAGSTLKLTNGNVKITFKYNDNYDSSLYDINVYHLKNDNTLETLPVTKEESSFSFEATSFSPYAVVYVKKETSTQATDTSNTELEENYTLEESVSTGDTYPTYGYILLLAISLTGFICAKTRKFSR